MRVIYNSDPPLVDAWRVVHGLHAAAGDGLDVDLLLAGGQRGEAAGGEGQVRHLVIARVPAERLSRKRQEITICKFGLSRGGTSDVIKPSPKFTWSLLCLRNIKKDYV